MQRTFLKLTHRLTWQWWQFFYVLFSLNWLLGPALNPQLSAHTTFISQYEDPGHAWSWLYRLCDVLAAVLLGLAVYVIARRRKDSSKIIGASLILLAVIAAGSFIDDAFPSACHGGALCLVPQEFSRYVHMGESVVTAGALIALNAVWAYRRLPWARTVLAVQLLWAAAFIGNQLSGRPDIGLLQFSYQTVAALWVAALVPYLAGRPAPAGRSPRSRRIVHLIAAWVFAGGFVAVASSIGNLKEISEHSAAYFGDNTAWLSQHQPRGRDG